MQCYQFLFTVMINASPDHHTSSTVTVTLKNVRRIKSLIPVSPNTNPAVSPVEVKLRFIGKDDPIPLVP
jgi:hypothetical protein